MKLTAINSYEYLVRIIYRTLTPRVASFQNYCFS